MEILSRNLSYLIKQSNKTAGAIAKDLGKSASNISNWSGGYAKPGLDDFVALVLYFGVSAHDLLFVDLQKPNNQVNEPQAEYKNETHLKLLIESYEIRLQLEKDLNTVLSANNQKLQTNSHNLQTALNNLYIKEKDEKKVIIKSRHR